MGCTTYSHHQGNEWIIAAGGKGNPGVLGWNQGVNYYDLTLNQGWNTLEDLPHLLVWAGQSQAIVRLNKYGLYIPNFHSSYGIMVWDYTKNMFNHIQENLTPSRVSNSTSVQ